MVRCHKRYFNKEHKKLGNELTKDYQENDWP